MGTYGIGINRTMAAIIEQNNDANGIIWPMSVAPYHAIVIPVNPNEFVQMDLAEKIYNELQAKGVQVIIDDRDERPGVKFKDADLIGIPLRITVGKKAGNGIVEFKYRKAQEVLELSPDGVIKKTITEVRG